MKIRWYGRAAIFGAAAIIIFVLVLAVLESITLIEMILRGN